VACAVADIKVECMDEESKDEERKDDWTATLPPLRNCHVLADVNSPTYILYYQLYGYISHMYTKFLFFHHN
jgi:hypothetical protein